MTDDETKLWSLFRSGQMPFAEFKKQYEELTGELVPDSVGRLSFRVGPITKRRHDYLQRMGAETAGRVE